MGLGEWASAPQWEPSICPLRKAKERTCGMFALRRSLSDHATFVWAHSLLCNRHASEQPLCRAVCHKIQVARRVQLGLGWAYAVVVVLLVVPCHRLTVRCMRAYQRPLALSKQALLEEASGEVCTCSL